VRIISSKMRERHYYTFKLGLWGKTVTGWCKTLEKYKLRKC